MDSQLLRKILWEMMSKALVTKGQVSNIHSLIHKLSHLVIQEEGIVKLNLDFINPLWPGLMPWLSCAGRVMALRMAP